MLEQTYSVTSTPKFTTIRGRSLDEFYNLIGSECIELLNFMMKFGVSVSERNKMLEIVIPRDCPIQADSIISKIHHAKRVARCEQDKMWKGSI